MLCISFVALANLLVIITDVNPYKNQIMNWVSHEFRMYSN